MVAATVACWYVGIVATNSDYAFTVSNVFVHGIPYLVLVYLYARGAARERESARGIAARLVRRGVLVFLAMLVDAFARKRRAGDNPWGVGATTLEWTVSSPPPFHTFNDLPKVV